MKTAKEWQALIRVSTEAGTHPGVFLAPLLYDLETAKRERDHAREALALRERHIATMESALEEASHIVANYKALLHELATLLQTHRTA